MNENNDKKKLLVILIFIAAAILLVVGATFAYFSTTITSNENAISLRSTEIELGFEDDTSLIKRNVIPSEERFVDIAVNRTDANGFLKPYENNGNMVTAGTACIDDNLNEICSIYTFTIINNMTDTDIPLYITLNQNINEFENLYFKVLDSSLNEVIGKTHLVDDRPYTIEGDTKVYDPDDRITPIVLTEINTTLARAVDSSHPSTVTYSIVMWVDENFQEQNATDGGKVFASTLHAIASGANGQGITGVISAAGND